jgi:predicted MFS family arabinose efflux permease
MDSPPRLHIGRAGRLFVICMGPSLGGLVPIGLAIAQPSIAEHFGGGAHGVLLARLLMSLPSLMIMVGAPLTGYAAERIGYRASLLFWLAVYGVSGCAGLFLQDFAGLLVSRLFLGLAGGGIMAIYLALATAYYEGAARARVFGFSVASSAAAGVTALFIGGRLVDWGGWSASFWMYAVAFVVLAVAWFTIRGPFHKAARRAPIGFVATVALIGRLWPVYLVLLLLSVGTFTPSSGGPFLLKANGIESATAQGNILSAGSVPSIVTAFAYGFLRRWLSDRALLIVTALLMGSGLLLLVPLHGTGPMLVTFVMIGLGAGLKAPSATSVLMAEADEGVRAAAAGLNFSCVFLGQFLAPLALDVLGRPFGIHGAFLAIGAVLLGVAAAVTFAGIGRPAAGTQAIGEAA